MNRAQHPQRLRTAGGDDRTSNKARGMGSQKASPQCHPTSSHNPHGSSLTQGAEPSEPLQAIRRRRSTENIREGLQPNLRHRRSSRPGIRCQKRQKPRRATCGRGSCTKPQAPEEEHGTRWKTKSLTQDTANPTDRAPPQEQDRQQEPEKVAEPSKGNLRQETPRKTAGRGTEANSSQWLNTSQPHA